MSAVAVSEAGSSGRRWDLWQSEDRIDTDRSWVGLIKEQADGSFVGRSRNVRLLIGPLDSFDAIQDAVIEASEYEK
jgi:hypothetical protein